MYQSRVYRKGYTNLILSSPHLATVIEEKVNLFSRNPDDTRLKNHALKKSMDGKYAFSITDDIRIIYTSENNKTVRFLAIGGHEVVYKKKRVVVSRVDR